MSLWIAVLLLGAAATVVPAATGVSTPRPVRSGHDARAAEVLRSLTLPQRVGQLVMTSVPGATLSSMQHDTLARLQPGGIILFTDNYRSRTQLRRLTARLATMAPVSHAGRVAPLISVDQEGGVVRRLADVPPTRSHPQLGRTNRLAVTRAQAVASARALRELGISMSLAPVADLDHGPRHVMGQRSFQHTPRRTGAHVAAFIDGLQVERVAASVKHFPGFGAAQVNSDDALATIGRTRRQLDADLLPFRAAVRADVASVMVSHAVYRALDRRRPASTSPVVYRLLRTELGYDGIAITDSLHAAGFGQASGATVARGCVETISAGADIALLTGALTDAVQCRAAVITAVRAGMLSRSRIDQAAHRVLRAKARLGLLS